MNISEEKEQLEKYINEGGLGVVFQFLIYQYQKQDLIFLSIVLSQ
jgi:hypothetical protein